MTTAWSLPATKVEENQETRAALEAQVGVGSTAVQEQVDWVVLRVAAKGEPRPGDQQEEPRGLAGVHSAEKEERLELAMVVPGWLGTEGEAQQQAEREAQTKGASLEA